MVIVRNGGDVLLARHRYYPHDEFVLIAGYIEAGESPEEAAMREVCEETGLHVRIESILGNYSAASHLPDLTMVACVATAGSRDVTLSDELMDARWFALRQLPSWPSDWAVTHAFADYLGESAR
jgi:NADH pyrophosphatase NudC (nudix superfamily)